MPLKFNCPHCGQPTEVPDEAINRMARCTTCHNIYAVRGALQVFESAAHGSSDVDRYGGSSARDRSILGFGLGIPAIAFVFFLVYWFGYRDTWETDNFTLINQQCDAVLQAIRAGDNLAAEAAYLNLDSLIGNRMIAGESLASRVTQARNEYAPVRELLAKIRQEQEARKTARLEEQQRHEEARRRAIAQSDRHSFHNPFRDPPYLANDISGHQTRMGALAALAVQFDKDISWVEKHMGSSNDLGDIHRNLNIAMFQEAGLWPTLSE